VRLVGISISSLVPEGGQRFLLEELEKQEKLSRAVDAINKQYGEFTVKPSSLLIAEKFGIRDRCGIIGTSLIKRRG
jgi:hypothetical protein